MTRVEREAEEARSEVEGRLTAAAAALDERAAALSAAVAEVRPPRRQLATPGRTAAGPPWRLLPGVQSVPPAKCWRAWAGLREPRLSTARRCYRR